MRHISLMSVSARLSVTLLLLFGSISTSAQYYLNVYEKNGSNNQYEIANLDSVSISDVKEIDTTPVLTILSISQSEVNLETGASTTLSVKGYDADGVEMTLEDLKWKSSDYSVASVDENGAVRTYKSGSATIVASLGNVSDTCVVIIKDHVYTLDEVVKLSLDKVALNVETGDGDSLSIRGFAADGVEIPLSNIQWNTDNSSVATVTDNGVVKTIKSGKALIIASLGNVSDTCTVTVVDHIYTLADVVKIAINKDTLNLETGQKDTLKAIGLAPTGVEIPLENILWKSTNTSVASINENGIITTSFLTSGNVILTASFGQYTDTCVLVVVNHVYTIDDVTDLTIDKEILNLETEDVDTLIVNGYSIKWYGNYEVPLGDNLIWKTSNPSVVTVDDNGVIKANMKGNATITASLGEISVSCSVSVRDKFVAIDVTIDSLAKSGVYIGVMSFNKQLYTKPISILNTDSKNAFDSFIDGMEMKNGTLLCYSVDNAIDSLGSVVLPDNVSKVAIVTFTDGLDQGSIDMIEAVTGQYYDSDDEYLAVIKHKIKTYSLAGVPITAYSVGVRGSDVKDLSKFQSTLKQLASSDEYAIEVQNMSEVNAKFKEIASQLNRSVNYQTVPIIMPGLSNGARVRFTFDNVADATKSTLYVEGTYNRRDRTLTDVEYHGMTSTSGSVVAGEITEVIFTKFTFENILTNDNSFINKAFINEWYMTPDGLWQQNSEFDPDQQPDIELEQSSIVIMLVLDCSSSLGDDFGTAKDNAKDFISTMYSATGGDGSNNGNGGSGNNLNDNFSIYSKTPIDLSLAVSIDGVRYYLTQEQYQKANLSKAIIEGLTVVLGDDNFIISLQEEPILAITQPDALNYYSDLPTQSQGQVVSARWSYINEAIKAFGGTGLNSSFWTNYQASSGSYPCYYVYSGGGNLAGYSTTDRLPVRLFKSTTAATPIIWRDENDLTLVASKDSEEFNFSISEWSNIIDKAIYEIKGVYVAMGKQSFILSLQNEAIDNVIQSYAISSYGPMLPTYSQGYIISQRWDFINSAIKAFGGTELNSSFWTGYKASSGSYPCLYVYNGSGYLGGNSTSDKLPVRLVYSDYNLVINPIEDVLVPGTRVELSSKLFQDNQLIDYYETSWSSNNPSVAYVTTNGTLTALSTGTAIITAKIKDFTDSYTITVKAESEIEHEYVDLGLSVKWATFNVGASKPEQVGAYYAWGETEAKTSYTWSNYKYWVSGSDKSVVVSKYAPTSNGNGTIDGKYVLELEDDVAYVKWGEGWRMPTSAEFEELQNNCIWTKITINGVTCYRVTSKIAGYTDRSIYFPVDTSISSGYVMTSSAFNNYGVTLPGFTISGSVTMGYYGYRYNCYPVRPVHP